MRDTATYLAIPIFALAIVVAVMGFFSGPGGTGRIERGHYYLEVHGRKFEVDRQAYERNEWWSWMEETIDLPVLWISGILIFSNGRLLKSFVDPRDLPISERRR